MWPNLAIFSKKVVFSETVRDRAERTKIWDHKGYNVYNMANFVIFSKKVVISETGRARAKWMKIWDHNGYNM